VGIVWVAGFLADDRNIAFLIKALLNGRGEFARWAAAEGLMRLRDVRGLEALSSALDDRASKVRMTAAQAICEFGDARAIESLERAAKRRPDDRVLGTFATKALSRLGGTDL
jgi:HEAT repeat protein